MTMEPGKTSYMYRSFEGQLNFADILNQAYMRQFFPNTTVLSAVGMYPFKMSYTKYVTRTVNVLGALIYPICLSMSLPVFLYAIVIEKESKQLATMRMNGLKMFNYWFCNFFCFLFFYSMTAFTFVFVGSTIF